MKHEIDHRDKDHRLAAGQGFVVFAVATVTSQPSEGSFHDPPFGQDLEPRRIGAPFDDLQTPAAPQIYNPVQPLPSVAAIGPHQPQPTPTWTQPLQHQPGPSTVLNIGRVNHDHQDQSQRVNDDMSLAPVDFLPRVVAATAPLFSVVLTDGLSIMAAEGVGFLPAAMRVFSRRRS